MVAISETSSQGVQRYECPRAMKISVENIEDAVTSRSACTDQGTISNVRDCHDSPPRSSRMTIQIVTSRLLSALRGIVVMSAGGLYCDSMTGTPTNPFGSSLDRRPGSNVPAVA